MENTLIELVTILGLYYLLLEKSVKKLNLEKYAHIILSKIKPMKSIRTLIIVFFS